MGSLPIINMHLIKFLTASIVIGTIDYQFEKRMQHIDKTPPQPSPWQGEGAVRRVGRSVANICRIGNRNYAEHSEYYLIQLSSCKNLTFIDQ